MYGIVSWNAIDKYLLHIAVYLQFYSLPIWFRHTNAQQ